MNKTKEEQKTKLNLMSIAVVCILLSSCATKHNPLDKFPSLRGAKVKMISVPDRIEGNTFIEAHKVYVIEEPSAWKTRN